MRNEVRERILREAQCLGYRPDPRLAYLSRLRWSSGRSGDSVKILMLIDRFTGADLRHPKFRELERTAAGLGYEIEYAYAEETRKQGARLSRQYTARGIRGVLISLHVTSLLPALRWEDFSVVIVGEEYADQPFTRVGTDWRQGFDLLTERMKESAESIGFCLIRYSARPDSAGGELSRILHAEALLQQAELLAEGRGGAPVFRCDETEAAAPARFRHWIGEYGIDAFMCNSLFPPRWLEQNTSERRTMPKPYLLPWIQEAVEYGLQGCSLNLGNRFSLGIRLLHENLLLDRRGYVELPTKTLVPMKWEKALKASR